MTSERSSIAQSVREANDLRFVAQRCSRSRPWKYIDICGCLATGNVQSESRAKRLSACSVYCEDRR